MWGPWPLSCQLHHLCLSVSLSFPQILNYIDSLADRGKETVIFPQVMQKEMPLVCTCIYGKNESVGEAVVQMYTFGQENKWKKMNRKGAVICFISKFSARTTHLLVVEIPSCLDPPSVMPCLGISDFPQLQEFTLVP